ncbi:MAG: hypothetical protein DRQ39_03490 [Gammaproteobacteria bacterium]|nr:MAG: hypothetical protein DRQ39_03490 [Gammaproteobacteria bacterium]
MNEEERLSQLRALEIGIHAKLHEYHVACRKVNGPDMMYDERGASSFVVVAFNRIVSPGLLPEDADANDVEAAVACATGMISPDVSPNEHGAIGPDETIAVGVHATAGSMLLSSIQQGAAVECMKTAQSYVLKHLADKRGAH